MGPGALHVDLQATNVASAVVHACTPTQKDSRIVSPSFLHSEVSIRCFHVLYAMFTLNGGVLSW